MNNSVKVSVVMPVYNTAHFVGEAVESVLNQTFKDFELIIINDGSTDNSLVIIDDLKLRDSRIVIISQDNAGLSAARNRGIELAQGEFIFFMDSDDLISSDTLLLCYGFACEENLDIVFFDAMSFSSNSLLNNSAFDYSRKQYINKGVYSGKEILRLLLNNNAYKASACLYIIKMSLLSNLKLDFYPNILHEDELFTPLLFINSDKVGYLPFDFYNRRIREGSIMNKKYSTLNLKSYLTVLKQLDKSLLRDQNSNDIVDAIKAIILNVIAYRSSNLDAITRFRLMGNLIKSRYLKYLSIKNIIILLFPVTIKIKSLFK